MTLSVSLSWDPMPHQRELLRWRPPPDRAREPAIIAALGGYGSAKTTAVGMAFALHALRNGWHDGWGKRLPPFVVMGPSLRLAKRNQLDLIDSLLPNDLIRKRRGMPEPRLQLINGAEIIAVSADAVFEGENLVGLWADEISHPAYATNLALWPNMVARVRSPEAGALRIFVSGLPLQGFVRDTFEALERGEGLGVVRRWSTKLNTKLPPGVWEQILAACPAGQEGTLLRGEWGTAVDAAFPQWSREAHLTDDPGNKAAPVSIGLDIGNRSSAIFAQRYTAKVRRSDGSIAVEIGMHVVDEIVGDGLSMDELCAQTKARGWPIVPGKSEIYVDPTLRRDEINAIRAAFGASVWVKVRERSDEYYDVQRGVRLLQSAMRDALGNTRLRVSRSLLGTHKGLIAGLENLRVHPTGAIKVHDGIDHPVDACRYVACGILGPQPMAPQVASRR